MIHVKRLAVGTLILGVPLSIIVGVYFCPNVIVPALVIVGFLFVSYVIGEVVRG